MAFGLVFAGGGVRGAYHIGVWKALNEMNIMFLIILAVWFITMARKLVRL